MITAAISIYLGDLNTTVSLYGDHYTRHGIEKLHIISHIKARCAIKSGPAYLGTCTL